MIIPDANLLIYAYDKGSPWHRRSAAWWERTLNGDEPVGLSWLVVFAFVRISTHSGINEDPLSLKEVDAILAEWEGTRLIRYLSPGPGHRRLFMDLLAQAGHAGNLINDAHLAALGIEHGGTVYSNDTDFGRFQNLRWMNPLSPAASP
jgi:uncharacterized protein